MGKSREMGVARLERGKVTLQGLTFSTLGVYRLFLTVYFQPSPHLVANSLRMEQDRCVCTDYGLFCNVRVG